MNFNGGNSDISVKLVAVHKPFTSGVKKATKSLVAFGGHTIRTGKSLLYLQKVIKKQNLLLHKTQNEFNQTGRHIKYMGDINKRTFTKVEHTWKRSRKALAGLIIKMRTTIRTFGRFTKASTVLGSSLQKLGTGIQKVGSSLTTYLSLPILGGGIFSVKSFADFEKSMTDSLSIFSRMSSTLRKAMRKEARAISRETNINQEELAKSYFYTGSANLTGEQSIKALRPLANFAIAAGIDMKRSSELLLDAQNVMGLASKNPTKNMENMIRVSNVLVKANTLAQATTEEFAEALSNKIGGGMRNLNRPIEEVVAILTAYAKVAKKGAIGGQWAYMAYRDLQTRAIRSADQWKKAGMHLYENGKIIKFGNAIKQLEQKFKGLNDEQRKTLAIQLGFQDRSWAALEAVIGMSDTILRNEQILKEDDDATLRIATNRLSSFTNKMVAFWHRLKGVAMDVGELLVPVVLLITKVVDKLIKKWRSLAPNLQRVLVILAAMLMLLGPIILVFGKFVYMIGTLLLIVPFIVSSFTSLLTLWSSGFFAVLAPMALVIVQIVLIGTAIAGIAVSVFYAMYGKAGLITVWDYVKKAMVSFIGFVIGFIANFQENMQILGSWLRENWANILHDMGSLIMDVGMNMVLNFKTVFEMIGELFSTFAGWFTVKLDKIFHYDFVKAIKSGVKDGLEKIKYFVTHAGELYNNIGKNLGKNAKEPGRIQRAIRAFAPVRGIDMILDYYTGNWELKQLQKIGKMRAKPRPHVSKNSNVGFNLDTLTRVSPTANAFMQAINAVTGKKDKTPTTKGTAGQLGGFLQHLLNGANSAGIFTTMWNVTKKHMSKMKLMGDMGIQYKTKKLNLNLDTSLLKRYGNSLKGSKDNVFGKFVSDFKNMFGQNGENSPFSNKGDTNKVGDKFQELSMRRYTIDTVSNTAVMQKEQRVKAPGIESRLDTIIQQQKTTGFALS